MFPFQPFYPFHFDSHIGCCLRSIFGYIQSPDFFATLAFPRAIDHDIDFTVYAERFQVKNQVGIVEPSVLLITALWLYLGLYGSLNRPSSP